MSAKNKLQNKKLRKAVRGEEDTAWSQFPRTALSQFPHVAAINVLANCKNKSIAAKRKRIRRALSSRIEVPRIQPKDPAVKLAQDLQQVPLCCLINLIKHSARHASTCKHLLEKLSADSKFRSALGLQQTYHLGVMKQAQAEYTVRTSPRP